MSAPPTDDVLEAGLQALVGSDLSLYARETSPYSSTFPTERVSVETAVGPHELLCKYGTGYRDPVSNHRRGVAYEAIIYKDLIPARSVATPRFHGAFEENGNTCLVLDFVDGFRVNRTPNPQGLVWASTDLARFHAGVVEEAPMHLNVFDGRYFAAWAAEFVSRTRGGGTVHQAIARFRDSAELVVDILSDVPRTIIHGELYPDNVIVQELGTVVVDWESAGLGPGVLDFAMLTQGHWDRDVVDESEDGYRRHSGLGHTAKADRTLAAARAFAGAQLLYHLGQKETDGTDAALASAQIASQLESLAALTSR